MNTNYSVSSSYGQPAASSGTASNVPQPDITAILQTLANLPTGTLSNLAGLPGVAPTNPAAPVPSSLTAPLPQFPLQNNNNNNAAPYQTGYNPSESSSDVVGYDPAAPPPLTLSGNTHNILDRYDDRYRDKPTPNREPMDHQHQNQHHRSEPIPPPMESNHRYASNQYDPANRNNNNDNYQPRYDRYQRYDGPSSSMAPPPTGAPNHMPPSAGPMDRFEHHERYDRHIIIHIMVEEVVVVVDEVTVILIGGIGLLQHEERIRRETASIFVGNLPPHYDDQALRNLFEQVAPVVSSAVPVNQRSGETRRFGFITYGTREDAEKAMRYFANNPVDDHILRLDWTTWTWAWTRS
ncbi:hypothetical protein BDF22DRAFT_20214 [Syncephalis plumigaleata]|nr:hypothetical protein BDF22DRAFT_20214 [Syncephalis plumigaleata]